MHHHPENWTRRSREERDAEIVDRTPDGLREDAPLAVELRARAELREMR